MRYVIRIQWMDNITGDFIADHYSVLDGEIVLYPRTGSNESIHRFPLANIRHWEVTEANGTFTPISC